MGEGAKVIIEKLLERWFLLPLAPGAELAIAGLVVTVAAIFLRGKKRDNARDQLRVPLLIRLTSGAVIASFVLCVALQVFWVRPPTILWWVFALPLGIAAVGTLAVAVTAPRRSGRTGDPALVGIRRTWLSFTDRIPLAAAAIAGVLILVVTLICGAASSPDQYGRYVFIVFGDGAAAATFYGWMFGVPVLIGLLLLIAATWAALSQIATPAFSSPLAAQNEIASRRTISNAVIYLTGSVLAMTLGGILMLIGAAGSGSAGVGIPGVGDFQWSPGFSSFAGFFTWSGWFLRVASFVMLIVLVVGFVPSRSAVYSGRDAVSKRAQTR